MAWEGIEATLTSGDRTFARDNLWALGDAYDAATSDPDNIKAILIPAGDYYIEFELDADTPVIEFAHNVRIIGAASSITTLRFVYSSSGPTESIAFKTLSTVSDARLEGLTLVGPDDEAGTEPDGTNAWKSWALWIADMSRVTMIDVKTEQWYEAIRLDGSASGATAHLERCHIKSRGTRIRHKAPTSRSETEGLTLINCTIEQDGRGYESPWWAAAHPGIHQSGAANLKIIGGRSLGCIKGNPSPDIHSRGSADQDPSLGSREIAISDHYFGPNGYAGIDIRPVAAAVLIDNCVFAGTTGVFIGGAACTYHVTNCAFVGGTVTHAWEQGPLSEGSVTYSGNALNEPFGEEVEAFFSNCRFGAAIAGIAPGENGASFLNIVNGYASTVVRSSGAASKRWSFANCYFGNARHGRLFFAPDGVNIFNHCRFLDSREVDDEYPLEQQAGAIELYNCYKEGKQPFYFVTDQAKALTVTLVGCVLRQDSLRFEPQGPTFVRGSENEFGDYVDLVESALYDPELVTSDLQLKRGRSQPRAVPWRVAHTYNVGDVVRNGTSPRRVYECTVFDRRSVGEGPLGTEAEFTDGSGKWKYLRDDADYRYDKSHSRLVLNWNADWFEVDIGGIGTSIGGGAYADGEVYDFGSTTTTSSGEIRTIDMLSRTDSNRLVGATVQLYAVSSFRLVPGGNIATSRVQSYSDGTVATLRFSASVDGWVIV